MPERSSPIPSTFDEFEQQQRSIEKIEFFRQILADDAERVAKERPGERLVGLIVEKDTSEMAAIMRAAGRAGETPEADFVKVVPRRAVLGIDGQEKAPDPEGARDDSNGEWRLLPILFIATNGTRWGRAKYRVDERPA
jgi:hypothetical protein